MFYGGFLEWGYTKMDGLSHLQMDDFAGTPVTMETPISSVHPTLDGHSSTLIHDFLKGSPAFQHPVPSPAGCSKWTMPKIKDSTNPRVLTALNQHFSTITKHYD